MPEIATSTSRIDGARAAHAEVVGFLGSAAAYGRLVGGVHVIETHGALVFLAGDDVYKIKRPVRFSYMDFSTLEGRRRACLREIEINRPQAPEIYRGVVPITRERDGTLAIAGRGVPIEWAVHMRRFPDAALLAHVADRQGIDAGLARAIADAVHAGHRAAPRAAGEADGMVGVIDELEAALGQPAMYFDGGQIRRVIEQLRARRAACAPVLDARRAAGFVRRCHGDLHLGNIVLWNGRPTLFDAIEFDEALATIDTLYDLAFLLMDLDHRGLRAAANAVLNRYLWRSQALEDLAGLAAMPLFLGARAAIRAMVLAQRAALVDGAPGRRVDGAAQRYLDAAEAYLRPSPPRLLAVGGLSGTGKSTLAGVLAPRIGAAPGAVHLRSDLERKAMLGVGETDRLPASTYTHEASARVYRTLIEKSRAAIGAGHSVVVDAAFLAPVERASLAGLAGGLGVPFQGLWLTAPLETLVSRVASRVGDASDASPEVVRMQAAQAEKINDWAQVDAAGTAGETLRAACERLFEHGFAIDAAQGEERR